MAPNYTLSVVCIFSLATRKMILESGALEIFTGTDGLGGGPEQSNPGFPSWVPDWSVAIPGRARDSYKAAVDTCVGLNNSPDPMMLILNRVFVDRIAAPLAEQCTFDTLKEVNQRHLSMWLSKSPYTPTGEMFIDAFLRTLIMDCDSSNVKSRFRLPRMEQFSTCERLAFSRTSVP